MNPQDQTLAAKMQQLIEQVELVANALHDVAMVGWSPAVDAQRWAWSNEHYLREVTEGLTALLSSVSPTQPEPCRCRQLEKRARAIRLNDVLRMEHESELMKELRAFELVASLQMRIDVLEREVTSLSPAPEKK